MLGTRSRPFVCQTISYLVGCLDSMERGTVGRASLLNELEAKGVVLRPYLLTLEGFSTYLKASRLITKLRTRPSSSTL